MKRKMNREYRRNTPMEKEVREIREIREISKISELRVISETSEISKIIEISELKEMREIDQNWKARKIEFYDQIPSRSESRCESQGVTFESLRVALSEYK